MNAAEKGARRRAAVPSAPADRPGRGRPAVLVVLAAVALLLTGALSASPPVTGRAPSAAARRPHHVRLPRPAGRPAGHRRGPPRSGGHPVRCRRRPPAGTMTQGPVGVRRAARRRTAGVGWSPAYPSTGDRRRRHRRRRAGCSASAPTSQNGRTLGVTPCAAPRAQWWFTGAGAGLDHSSSLAAGQRRPGTRRPGHHGARARTAR